MNLENIKKNFDESGFIWIKDFFDPQDIDDYLEVFKDEKWINSSNLKNSPEISSNSKLKKILTNEKLVDLLKTLTDNDLTYFGISNCIGSKESNSISWRRLHVDTRGNPSNKYGKTYYDPSKKKWPVISVFIYLEDFEKFSGCLKVIKGSHRKFLPTIGNYIKTFINIRKYTKFDGTYSFKSIPMFNIFKMKNIKSKPGDLFVFNHALHHSPNSLILKKFPNLVLPVFLENLLEKFLPKIFKEKSKIRRMISICYGKQSQELERFNLSRTQFFTESFMNGSEFFYNKDFRDQLNSLGVKTNINLKKYLQEKEN